MTTAKDDFFTPGKIAKICRVSHGTAVKWIDRGLLAGERMPGSQTRRVTREALITFLRANGLSQFEKDVK